MSVWVVANRKGGVGKTTKTVTLGGLRTAWGFRTRMIDVDPPGSLTCHFGMDPDNITQSSSRPPTDLLVETLCILLDPTALEQRIRHG